MTPVVIWGFNLYPLIAVCTWCGSW